MLQSSIPSSSQSESQSIQLLSSGVLDGIDLAAEDFQFVEATEVAAVNTDSRCRNDGGAMSSDVCELVLESTSDVAASSRDCCCPRKETVEVRSSMAPSDRTLAQAARYGDEGPILVFLMRALSSFERSTTGVPAVMRLAVKTPTEHSRSWARSSGKYSSTRSPMGSGVEDGVLRKLEVEEESLRGMSSVMFDTDRGRFEPNLERVDAADADRE